MVTAWGRCPTCGRVHEPGACRMQPRMPRETFNRLRGTLEAMGAATVPRNAPAVTQEPDRNAEPVTVPVCVLPAGLVGDLSAVVGVALDAWVEATLRAAAKRHQAKARSNAERQRAHRERKAKAKNTGRADPGASTRAKRAKG